MRVVNIRSARSQRAEQLPPVHVVSSIQAGAMPRAMLASIGDILKLIWWAAVGLFRSRASLEAGILMRLQIDGDEAQ